MNPYAHLTVFLADDDEDDAYFFQRAVERTYPGCRLRRFDNGTDLVLTLQEAGAALNVVFLDLAIPRLDGFQVLEQIRQIDTLADLPVFILTVSEADQDIRRAYQLRASAYLLKPAAMTELTRLVQPAIRFAMNQFTQR
ncbi:response regulator [Fibrisoma montanum]|uniref:Response regulator n=1 Tax=Fibrisoma montanum TaxID=2305895 RepID=A0A418M2X1_9BACT|nr:response regulator [Fibrisoma montanum]RIV20026.1 response regulator [Fibrisoma montanum]